MAGRRTRCSPTDTQTRCAAPIVSPGTTGTHAGGPISPRRAGTRAPPRCDPLRWTRRERRSRFRTASRACAARLRVDATGATAGGGAGRRGGHVSLRPTRPASASRSLAAPESATRGAGAPRSATGREAVRTHLEVAGASPVRSTSESFERRTSPGLEAHLTGTARPVRCIAPSAASVAHHEIRPTPLTRGQPGTHASSRWRRPVTRAARDRPPAGDRSTTNAVDLASARKVGTAAMRRVRRRRQTEPPAPDAIGGMIPELARRARDRATTARRAEPRASAGAGVGSVPGGSVRSPGRPGPSAQRRAPRIGGRLHGHGRRTG